MKAHPLVARIRAFDPVVRTGRVRRLLATSIEADGPAVAIGAKCLVAAGPSRIPTAALAVKVDKAAVTLMPLEPHAATLGAKVTAVAEPDSVAVGDALLDRAIDPLGRPIDGKGAIRSATHQSVDWVTTPPLDRCSPPAKLETGLRAIDALLTLGRGQRVGIFAAAGVGKSSLLNQIARQVSVDRVVVCLVGERGREVEAFWNTGLPAEARARATLVAATSDQPAATRMRAGQVALTIADHWRREGRHVLLLVDSVTRLAMAMREIGLAAGEPPTVRAYTPSVFSLMPRLVEGCGALASGGAISAIFTVLSETDDVEDPVCEMMKSLLDGHVILSRNIAERGLFPAIDVPRSVSRQAPGLLTPHQKALSVRAAALISRYEASRTMIEAGLYAPGSDDDLDQAIARQASITDFLRQAPGERTTVEDSFASLSQAVA